MADWLRIEKQRSVRTYLVLFAAAISLPLILLLGVLLFRAAHLERGQLENRMLQVDFNLADDLDREIDRRLSMLQTLSTSPSLAREDWQSFHAEATAATQDYGYIVLVHNDGRQIVNTFVPYGSEPPLDGNPESVRKAVELKRVVISNVFTSLVTHKPVFNIRKPLLEDGEVRYVLSLGLLTESVLPILQTERLPEGWAATIRDGNNVVVAQLPDNERFAGTAVPADLIRQRALGRVVETTDRDGAPVLLASAASGTSDWRIDVLVPVSLATAPLRASLFVWVAAGIAAILLAIGLALVLARKLEVPLSLMAKSARELGRGSALPSNRSGVVEANVVMDAMQRASERLAERDAQRNLLMRELTHRVKNILAVVQAVVSRGLAEADPEVRERIVARIHSLSRAHDLLMNTNWQGVGLVDLIGAELDVYSGQVTTRGPDLTIKADLVQTLGLLLHELATNAVKHGALSTANGCVEVVWEVGEGEENGPRFVFRWQERGGPPVKPPSSTGFGSTLLATAIRPNHGNGPRLRYEEKGLIYEFDAPLDSVAEYLKEGEYTGA